MRTIVEQPVEVPVAAEVDVVVVGGGVGGIAAAVAAARNGAKVALVERLGFMGGCATATMMDVMGEFQAGNTPAVAGIAMEVVWRLRDRGALEGTPGHRVYFDSEQLKVLADEMVLEAGVDLWLHTFGVKPVLEAGRVSGVFIESKSGRQAILAKYTIDISGDADIAYRAGAAWEIGRPEDGRLQPLTLNFMVGNVKREAVEDYYRDFRYGDPYFARLVRRAKRNGDFPIPRQEITHHRFTPGGNLTGLNVTRIQGKDPTNVKDLTESEILARKQIYQIAHFLRKYVPGFEQCEIAAIATQIAGRESRRVKGGYELTKEDIFGQRKFPDAIAKFPSFSDIHDPVGDKVTLVHPDEGAMFDIPFRCLVPEKVDGILMAGKCISSTSYAAATIRRLSASMATGQAAGTAAALCAAQGIEARNMEVAALQAVLRLQGVIC
jgi:hypothetical protein